MEDADKIYTKLKSIENAFGIIGVCFAIAIIIIGLGLYIYFPKLLEKLADEASEKSLKKYQLNIDKELARFSVQETTKHQKQVDAIQEIYSHFQNMKLLIDFMLKGDKYTEPLNGHDEVAMLIQRRNKFKNSFNKSRILFKKELAHKMDKLIESVEEFIDIYRNGLMPLKSQEQLEWEQQQAEDLGVDSSDNHLYRGGIWRQNAFDNIMDEFQQISEEIEQEFRTIYGV
jgi:hypothetical protein